MHMALFVMIAGTCMMPMSHVESWEITMQMVKNKEKLVSIFILIFPSPIIKIQHQCQLDKPSTPEENSWTIQYSWIISCVVELKWIYSHVLVTLMVTMDPVL